MSVLPTLHSPFWFIVKYDPLSFRLFNKLLSPNFFSPFYYIYMGWFIQDRLTKLIYKYSSSHNEIIFEAYIKDWNIKFWMMNVLMEIVLLLFVFFTYVTRAEWVGCFTDKLTSPQWSQLATTKIVFTTRSPHVSCYLWYNRVLQECSNLFIAIPYKI